MASSKQFRPSTATDLFVTLEDKTKEHAPKVLVSVSDKARPDYLFKKSVLVTEDFQLDDLRKLFELANETTTKVLNRTDQEIKLGVSEVHWCAVLKSTKLDDKAEELPTDAAPLV